MIKLLVLLALLAGQSGTAATDNGTISGRVLNGDSRDGLAGVSVTLTSNVIAVRHVATAADGAFAFDQLPAGSYHVTASPSGFTDGAHGRAWPGGEDSVVELSDGQRLTGVDVPAWKLASISGTVVDEAGEPVVNAKVLAWTRPRGEPRAVTAASAKTDDRGIYRLNSLPPADYVLVVPALQGTEYPTTFWRNAARSSDATAVVLRAGEEMEGADVRLMPGRGVRVSGTVSGPGGPAADTPIELIPATSSTSPLDAALDAVSTVSDGRGAFRFDSVAAGSYFIRVFKDSARDETGPQASGPLTALEPVSVTDQDATVTVKLYRAPRVTGRIVFEGERVQPTPMQLQDLSVLIEAADGRGATDVRAASVSADGTFATVGAPPGRYVLRVTGVIPAWQLQSATFEAQDRLDVPIELGPSGINGVVVRFTDRTTELAATVRATDGAVDSEAVVLVFPADWTLSGTTSATSRRFRSARVNSAGAVVILDLPPDDYFVVAVPVEMSRDWQTTAVLSGLQGQATRIALAAGPELSVNLLTVRR